MFLDKVSARCTGRRLWFAIFALHCIAVFQILFINHGYYFLVRYSKTACEPIAVSKWCEATGSCVQVSKNFLEEAGVSTTYSSPGDVHRQLALYLQKNLRQCRRKNLLARSLPQLIALFDHPYATAIAEARTRSLLITNESQMVLDLIPAEWGHVPQRGLGTYDLAFVLPFHAKELPKVADWMKSWEMHPPCGPGGERSIRLHFVWAFAGDFGTPSGMRLKQALKGLWSQHELACFQSAHFVSLKQDPSLGHLDGACVTFYVLMHLLKHRFDFMQIMETDVRPIRSGWATAITKIVEPGRACQDWWVKGSSALCGVAFSEIDVRRDFHINGNSLYALGCSGFEEYLHRIQLAYPARPDKNLECQVAAGCETGRTYEGGYDHILFQYRQEPENSIYARYINNRFLQSFLLLNKCEDIYVPQEVAAIHPSTFLVHSKSVFIPQPTRSIYRIFGETLMRKPSSEDLMSLLPAIYSGELTLDALAFKLRKYKSVPEKVWVDEWETAYPDKVYLWTTDFHAGPVACNMPIYRDAGAVTHAEVDFENCRYFGLCKNRLKVLEHDNWRGFSLECRGKQPDELKKDFYKAYRNDPEFKRVDAFVCSHPAANCELFMQFNKPVIVHATTRLEFGRHDAGVFWRKEHWNEKKGKASWESWLKTLIRIKEDARSVIAANNLYDVHYIKYFTGITPEYIPSWCGDPNYAYNAVAGGLPLYQPLPLYEPTKETVLVGTYRTNLNFHRDGIYTGTASEHPIMKEMAASAAQNKIQVITMREMYPKGFTVSELCSHPAIVIIPYQTSTMSMFEYYRLNIPLFVPSNALLLKWWKEYDILWERIYGWPERIEKIAGPQDSKSPVPDPNSNTEESFTYWLQFADFNVFPHIQRFDDFDDLMAKLQVTDLKNISRAMYSYNRQERQKLVHTWRSIFEKIKEAKVS